MIVITTEGPEIQLSRVKTHSNCKQLPQRASLKGNTSIASILKTTLMTTSMSVQSYTFGLSNDNFNFLAITHLDQNDAALSTTGIPMCDSPHCGCCGYYTILKP